MIDKIITLSNNKKYLILDETILDNIKYYFGLRLNGNNSPTNNYLYFEEIKEDNNLSLKPIEKEEIKDILLTSFTINYFDKVYDLG